MKPVVHLLAACCDSKTRFVPKQRHLADVPVSSFDNRVEEWWRRLSTGKDEAVPAESLYSGQYWCSVLRARTAAIIGGIDLKLWVASAGYGLIAADRLVYPYSATFASGHQDSVTKFRDYSILRQWWSAIGARRHAEDYGRPRSVAALAADNPKATLMVVASPQYVEALSDDLANAANALSQSRRLIIITSQVPGRTELAKNTVLSTAAFQAELAGARVSLHARVACKVLREAREHPLDALELRDRFQQLHDRLYTEPPPPRKAISDEEAKRHINRLKRSGFKSASRALRQLRDEGLACEQKRFGRLFKGALEK